MDKILKFFTFTEVDFLGTYGNDDINKQSYTDIDIQTIQRNFTVDDIYEFFKNLFIKLKDNKRLVITDFKTGVYKANIPIRWDYKSITKGFQFIEGKGKVNFKDQLFNKSIIKIDFLEFRHKKDKAYYQEYSVNYYFYIKKDDGTFDISFNNNVDINSSLAYDIEKYKKEGNYFKSLKRLLSFYEINNKKSKSKRIIDIINSKFGILARQKQKLQTLLFVLNNKRLFNKDDIHIANPENLSIKDIENKMIEIDKEINSPELLDLIKKYKLYI